MSDQVPCFSFGFADAPRQVSDNQAAASQRLQQAKAVLGIVQANLLIGANQMTQAARNDFETVAKAVLACAQSQVDAATAPLNAVRQTLVNNAVGQISGCMGDMCKVTAKLPPSSAVPPQGGAPCRIEQDGTVTCPGPPGVRPPAPPPPPIPPPGKICPPGTVCWEQIGPSSWKCPGGPGGQGYVAHCDEGQNCCSYVNAGCTMIAGGPCASMCSSGCSGTTTLPTGSCSTTVTSTVTVTVSGSATATVTVTQSATCSPVTCACCGGTSTLTTTVTQTVTVSCGVTCGPYGCPPTPSGGGTIEVQTVTAGALVNVPFWPKWCSPQFAADLDQYIASAPHLGGVVFSVMLGLRDINGNPQTPVWLASASSPLWSIVQSIWNIGSVLNNGPFVGFGKLATFFAFIASGNLMAAIQSFEPDPEQQVPESAWLPDAIANTLRGLTDWAGQVLIAGRQGAECSPAISAYFEILHQLMQFIQHWTGIDFSDLSQTFKYVSDAYCPTQIPSAGEADQAFLRGDMPFSVYRTYIPANDKCFVPHTYVVWSQRTRTSVEDDVKLWLRGLYSDAGLAEQLRRQGMLDPLDVDAKMILALQVPHSGELIRMIQRQVCDDSLASRWGLDANRDSQICGPLDNWLASNGTTVDGLKYTWRAHWTMPSPGELLQMYWRLRPGVAPPGLDVDKAELSKALDVHGIAPLWRDRMLAISERPLMRRDLQQAYNTGSLTDKELYDALQNIGYADGNLQDVFNTFDSNRNKYLLTIPAVKQYLEGGLSDDEITNDLQGKGYEQSDVDYVTQYARTLLKRTVRLECIKGVKKKYLHGALTDQNARDYLTGTGMAADLVDLTVNGWTCEKTATDKTIPAATLCDWYDRGLLTTKEYRARLIMLGYSDDDATHIMTVCTQKYLAKLQAAMQKELEKLQKEKEKLLREQKREHDLAVKLCEKLRASREKAAEGLQTATNKWANLNSIDYKLAGDQITEQINRLISTYKATPSDAITTMVEVGRFLPKTGSVDLFKAADEMWGVLTEYVDVQLGEVNPCDQTLQLR